MTKWVRVSDSQLGCHRTTTREELATNPNLRELKQDPLTPGGAVREPKFKTSLSESADSENKAPEAAEAKEAQS